MSDILYTLKFHKNWFSFRKGYNTSVRRGLKHYNALVDYFYIEDKDITLKLVSTDKTDLPIYAKLIAVDRIKYKDITLTESYSNHACRGLNSLNMAMEAAYKNFNILEEVTIIGFDI